MRHRSLCILHYIMGTAKRQATTRVIIISGTDAIIGACGTRDGTRGNLNSGTHSYGIDCAIYICGRGIRGIRENTKRSSAHSII